MSLNNTTATKTPSTNVWVLLGNNINKAQYFCPIFSWFAVTYTYFTIGRKGAGPIWKYLFYVVTFGFLANILDITKQISLETKFHFETIQYISWIETYLFGLNEWGFVFINFKKIKSCVKLLNNKIWSVFISLFLLYILGCRTIITRSKFKEDWSRYIGQAYEDKSINYHAILYIPIGIVEIILIVCVIDQYLSEKKSTIRNELSILFHSTLSRTLMISILYILIAVSVLIDKYESAEFARKCFWRIKGILGIVFLVDLLLLRIDLDQNDLKKEREKLIQQQKLDMIRSASISSDYQQSNNIFSSNRSTPISSPFSTTQSPLPPTNEYNYHNANFSSINRSSTHSSVPLVSHIDYKQYML